MNTEFAPRKSRYNPPDVAIVGVVVGAWGYGGEVKVQSHTDNPQRFSKGNYLMANGRVFKIERNRWHKGLALTKFHEVDTREDATCILGFELSVSLDQVPALSLDNYYHFQIIGMEVWSVEGDFLGTVEDILSTGSNDVYVVRDNKNEVLLPAIKDVILTVDLDRGHITVDLPEGLLP